MIGLCVPDTCNNEDVTKYITEGRPDSNPIVT